MEPCRVACGEVGDDGAEGGLAEATVGARLQHLNGNVLQERMQRDDEVRVVLVEGLRRSSRSVSKPVAALGHWSGWGCQVKHGRARLRSCGQLNAPLQQQTLALATVCPTMARTMRSCGTWMSLGDVMP